MIWDEYCSQYLAKLEEAKLKLPKKDIESWDYWGWSFWIAEFFTFEYVCDLLKSKPEIVPDFSCASDEDIQWFIEALEDERRKWFALCIIAHLKTLPDIFFPALVRAAVHEINPSLNEHFIGVACRFGSHRVAEKLFEYAEYGTGFEREVALHAFYWVIWFSDPTTDEVLKVLALFEAIAVNQKYSDTVREHARRNHAYLKYHLETTSH